jgi:phosphate transporter
MKFSYQLAYNAFAPWSENYVNYKKLKKLMKRQRREMRDKTQTPQNWEVFSRELLSEIDKFGVFFNETWSKLRVKVDVLCQSLQSTPQITHKDQKRRKSAIELYLELSELKKFIFLNAEGARKLVKKFDKLNGSGYLEGFIESSDLVQDMISEQRSIDGSLDRLLTAFAEAFTDGDPEAASGLLSKSLTDLVEWEKGTIWNDLLRLERSKNRIGARATMARVSLMKKTDEVGHDMTSPSDMLSTTQEIEMNKSLLSLMCQWIRNPLVLANIIVLILSGMAYFEKIPGLPFHAARCLSVLFLVSGWWSLGTFPLFVSALAVPLLIVACDVLPLPSRADAAKLVLSHMWGGSQAMVLASFALAAALSKLRLDKQLACVIISLIKNGRRKIMFAFMVIGWSTSFAIGNMASSVLCLSLAAPVLDELPQLDPATADYGKRLLISIAFAANFGGMTSPIASPQNIVAFASMQPFGTSFAQWVFVAVPTSFILLVVTFGYLMPVPRARQAGGVSRTTSNVQSLKLPLLPTSLGTDSEPNHNDNSFEVETELPPRLTDGMRRKFEWDWRRQAVVGLLCFAAALWMASSVTVAQFGDVGLASLLPLLLLFALPGVLNKSDFLSMPWDVCLLLASGGVLSAAVSQSQLLAIAGESASNILATMSPLMCLVVCCVFVTVVSTGVSHTAAANVLMPFIVELGKSVYGRESAVRFILPVSLCLSAGMALPVSSCPNMNATAIARGSDESVAWVKPTDYLKPGLVLSVVTVVVFVLVADPLTAYFCT